MTHEIEDTLSNDAGQPGNGALRRAPRKKKGGKARVWKPDNSRFYHMEFWYRGRRYTGTTKRTDRGEAVAYAKGEREKAIAAHVNFGPYLGRDMSFGEAVNRYFEERGQHVADPKHLERQLNWLLDKAGDATPLSQIDNNLLAKLMATKKNEYRWGDPNCGKVSNQTVNHVVLDLVRLILRKARLDWNIMLPAEPHYRRHRLKVSQRTAEFSLSQEEALVSQRPEDYGPLVRFGIKTALRKRDLLLRWDQVDWDNECIKVRAKGDVDHEVPLTPSIKAMLDAQKGRHDEFVWTFVCRRRTTLRSGEVLIEGERYPVTYNSFSGAFARMRKDAGIKDRRIHDLRKTAGARMHRVTGDLGCVQELLGHANISLTRKHYTNITRKDRERRMIETEEAYENKRALMLADESSE